MKIQRLPRNHHATPAPTNYFHLQQLRNTSQDVSRLKLCGGQFTSKLLERKWSLLNPDAQIHQVMISKKQIQNEGGSFNNISFSNNTHPYLGDNMMKNNRQHPSFYVVRDDLLHPLVNGNKARKLDGLLPLIEDHSVTDVVSCGGCQSAHAAALERGLRSHLLLRGEQPEILTGYNLISTIYGNVTYVPRSLYAKREEMLMRHADMVAGSSGSVISLSDIYEASFTASPSGKLSFVQMGAHRRVENCSKRIIIVNEGAGDAVGLLGVIRLVRYLSNNLILGKERPVNIVVDAGTGTTAVGLGLGVICLGLPWKVTAVMLADTIDGYKQQEKRLISDFKRCSASHLIRQELNRVDGGIVHWVERRHPRKFGNVLEGELEACQSIARQTGVLVDPVYTLAAWELATLLSQEEAKDDTKVVMLHTGGTLCIFGLAQRYKSLFQKLEDGLPS
ncbi:D-cysteine desulfhydrase 2, mitochondrial isoform X2 [Malania oleifera]|uniref:D-cysteine desulfhydrase 2, mitochondrial isoform X2 n=1 Tax=Malania oleifera TaxID=397392 RepID=UPI0025AE661F|nr:D-cysteine desulfhydrase 2, mitochondrial isoform X2 [Malania oleifera]